MLKVGERVDDWNLGAGGHLGDGFVRVGAEHDDVHPALEVAGHVGERLALAEGRLRLVDEDGVAAEGVDGGFEGEAGTQRGLLEEHHHLLASSAWRKSSGWFLTACASSMIAAISCTVRSAMEQRSRPQRRLEASLKAVSDWMPRVAVGLTEASSSPAISVGLRVHHYCFATHGIVLLPALRRRMLH